MLKHRPEFEPQKKFHSLPSRASCGGSIASSLGIIDHVIMAPNCDTIELTRIKCVIRILPLPHDSIIMSLSLFVQMFI